MRSASALPEGPSSLSTQHKEALLTFLGIPTELPSQDSTSLRTLYTKYKVLNDSTKQMGNLRSNQEWTNHLEELGVEYWVPIFVDLLNIFIAKSQFYASWKPSFTKALGYPEMIAWLDDDSGCESDSELWAETKDDYSLGDLKNWLRKKDVAKGKRPVATGSSAVKKEKRKKDKRVATESSSSESSEEKNVKAKAKAKKGKKKASE